jgi:hypothetical protein
MGPDQRNTKPELGPQAPNCQRQDSDTMNLTPQQIGIGLMAGLASALLSLGVASGSGFALLVYFLSPLPIMAAAIGWGLTCGIVAGVVATAVVGIAAAPLSGFVILLLTVIPGLVASWLIQLGRPASELGGPGDKTAWFPLADVLLRLALLVATGIVILGFAIGYGPEFTAQFAREMISNLQQIDPNLTFSEDFEPSFAAFLTGAIPTIQAATWMMVMTGNLYLALALVRRSRPGIRPGGDWPLALRLPRAGLAAFALATIVSFVAGPLGLIAGAFAGALGAAFTMAGVAMIHFRSQGQTWRGAALFATYGSMFIFAPAILVFTIIGMLDTTRAVPMTNTPKNPNT